MPNPAKTRRGTKLRILRITAEGPPVVFGAFCSFNAKEINFQTQTNDFYTPDCDNPDDPAWREIVKGGRSVTITGSGSLDIRDLDDYQDAYDSDTSAQYRVELDATNTVEGGYWSGNFMLTQFQVTGNNDGLVEISATYENDGAVTWVPATP